MIAGGGVALSYWNPTGDVSLINVPFARGCCVCCCWKRPYSGHAGLKGQFLNATALCKSSMRCVQGRNCLFSSWKQQNKSWFHGIMTNAQTILGNATPQKAISTLPPTPEKKGKKKILFSDLFEINFTTQAKINSEFWEFSRYSPEKNSRKFINHIDTQLTILSSLLKAAFF